MKHRWKSNNGDTCSLCGLHREGAGAGPYGSMRYYRDSERGSGAYKPGTCPGAAPERIAALRRLADTWVSRGAENPNGSAEAATAGEALTEALNMLQVAANG